MPLKGLKPFVLFWGLDVQAEARALRGSHRPGTSLIVVELFGGGRAEILMGNSCAAAADGCLPHFPLVFDRR